MVSERFRLVEIVQSTNVRPEENQSIPHIMLLCAAGHSDLGVVWCMEPEFQVKLLTLIKRQLKRREIYITLP